MICDKLTIGEMTFNNRVVFQPMEGCDCETDGAPGELTRKKYESFLTSGAGTVWFEANAIVAEGRTNPRQMFLHAGNIEKFQRFLDYLKSLALKTHGFVPKTFFQLTHSGRQSMVPQIMYRNSVYEISRPLDDEHIVSDDYLDALPDKFAAAAVLAEKAGFDGVDIKCCHGYLLQESLSSFNREGRYGGSFENRSRLVLSCVDAVSAAVSRKTVIASRLGASDMVPKPYGFGTDDKGQIDLNEPIELIKKLNAHGLKLINLTIGNPYYNPHINRPFRVGAYTPNEPPETGIRRFREVTKTLKQTFPDVFFVQSGLSYYKENMIEEAEAQLKEGVCDLVGFGRQILAYPSFFADWQRGMFDGKKCCVACSRCTSLMRHKQPSGCAVFNPYYKKLYKEEVLCKK